MKSYEVIPLQGVGPVFLGMTRDEVHAALGDQFQTFRKAPTASHSTDAWHDNAFQVFYGGSAPIVEYIELSRSQKFTVSLLGLSVFDTEAPELLSGIQAHATADAANPEQGFSYIFPDLELSVWRPGLQDTRFATIGIGRLGYYSNAA
jgi:hypothetical protein